MPDGGKALDVIHLEGERVGDDASNARNPEEPLDGGRVQEVALDRALERVDLLRQERDLGRVQVGLELIQGRQLGGRGDIEFLKEPVEAILTATSPLDQAEARAQHVARTALSLGDQVGLGNEAGP